MLEFDANLAYTTYLYCITSEAQEVLFIKNWKAIVALDCNRSNTVLLL